MLSSSVRVCSDRLIPAPVRSVPQTDRWCLRLFTIVRHRCDRINPPSVQHSDYNSGHVKVLPLSEVKAKLSEVVDQIVTTHERVTVTRNGRPVAVMLSSADLEAIEDTVAILSDPAAVQAIELGRAAIADGDVATREDIEALRDRLRRNIG